MHWKQVHDPCSYCVQTGSEYNIPLDERGGLLHLLVQNRISYDSGCIPDILAGLVQPLDAAHYVT